MARHRPPPKLPPPCPPLGACVPVPSPSCAGSLGRAGRATVACRPVPGGHPGWEVTVVTWWSRDGEDRGLGRQEGGQQRRLSWEVGRQWQAGACGSQASEPCTCSTVTSLIANQAQIQRHDQEGPRGDSCRALTSQWVLLGICPGRPPTSSQPGRPENAGPWASPGQLNSSGVVPQHL